MTLSKKGDITVEKLDLKPEWLEKTEAERKDTFGPYLVFLLVGAGLLILFLFSAGDLEKFMGIILLVWVSFSVIYTAERNTKSISTWRRTGRYDKVENLPLKRDSETMKRALSGLELSQTLVEKRLRRALMEKMKDEKDLSMKEMRELLKQPSELEKMVENQELNDFLLNSKKMKDVIRREDEDSSNFFGKEEERDRSFEKKIRDVIEKISGWEGR